MKLFFKLIDLMWVNNIQCQIINNFYWSLMLPFRQTSSAVNALEQAVQITQPVGIAGVHAVTDVTGFGLAGHSLEMARGAGVTVRLDPAAAPLLPGVEALVRAGVRTGASTRNWASYGEAVDLPAGFEDWRRDLLTDPQTSGGLLIAVAPGDVAGVMDLCRAEGFDRAAVVGEIAEGPARVEIAA